MWSICKIGIICPCTMETWRALCRWRNNKGHCIVKLETAMLKVLFIHQIRVKDVRCINTYRITGCKIINDALLRCGSCATASPWIKAGTGTWTCGKTFYRVEFGLQLDEKGLDRIINWLIIDYKKPTADHFVLQCAAVLMGPSVWRCLIWSAAAVKEPSLKLVPPIRVDSLRRKAIRASVSGMFHFAVALLVGDFGGILGVVDKRKRMI